MSLGLQVIAAAANHRPIDIKKLVEAALFDRASAVLTEGYKIVAAEQYGGLDEGKKIDSKKFGTNIGSRTSKIYDHGGPDRRAQADYRQDKSYERYKKTKKLRNPKRLPEDELDEVSKFQKDPEVTSYRSGKGKTPAKLDRDYGDGMTSTTNMKQRNTRQLKRYPDGISNKREMKAIVKRNKTKADYHSKTSHKRYWNQ
jgi:hypothetical protein